MRLQIRPAAIDRDAAAIAAVYAHDVLHGTGTFEESPPDAAEFVRRMAHVTERGWPWLVAEEDGAVIGYAYAAQFRDRAAYRYTCEDSIYLHPDAAGRGVGRALLEALIAAARAAGFRTMVAAIGDSANLGSIRLHERLGFHKAGVLTDVGCKFGRPLDVVFMQRVIG